MQQVQTQWVADAMASQESIRLQLITQRWLCLSLQLESRQANIAAHACCKTDGAMLRGAIAHHAGKTSGHTTLNAAVTKPLRPPANGRPPLGSRDARLAWRARLWRGLGST